MTLSEELTWRGFVNQTTLTDLTQLDTQKWTFYHGFDASADSQTIGNLAAMMLDLCFLRHGHTAILLAGGATSLIGDPGGKDKERPMQSAETIARNVANAEQQLKAIFREHPFRLVNNYDWYKDMSVLDYLRDVGKHFSMTPLVQRDYIAKRMGEDGDGISYTEFSYTLLQGYDFKYLYDNYGVTLQLSGSDQWGNSLSGIDLLRRTEGVEAHVLTLPLIINKATGKKFGKSEEGAVWLDPAKTSPTQFYQFWINCDDTGVEDYLKIYTLLSKDEIEETIARHREAPQQRIAQKRLAIEVTKLVHGQEQMSIAQDVTDVLTGANVGVIDQESVEALRREIPSAWSDTKGSLITALVETGLAASNSEARRLLAANAVSINGEKTQTEQFQPSDFSNGRLLIRRGKAYKDSALIELKNKEGAHA